MLMYICLKFFLCGLFDHMPYVVLYILICPYVSHDDGKKQSFTVKNANTLKF